MSAYQVAQRAAFTSAVASAITVPTAASVAVRIATGPVGWGLLGVSAALTLAGMYYSQADIAATRAAALAAQPTTLDSKGFTVPANGYVQEGCVPLVHHCVQRLFVPFTGGPCTGGSIGSTPTGWSALNKIFGTPSGAAGTGPVLQPVCVHVYRHIRRICGSSSLPPPLTCRRPRPM